MKNLIVYLEELEDPRDKRGLRHNLTNIIVMCIYAILCGCSDCESISYFLELRKEYFIKLLRLDKQFGVPSADTLPLPQGDEPASDCARGIDREAVFSSWHDWETAPPGPPEQATGTMILPSSLSLER